MDDLGPVVGVALALYVAVMLGLGVLARSRVSTVEDYVLAGRRLGLCLATPTLLATWFGAGTLLAATDEVRSEGLKAAALDPLGAGVCLLLAGTWIARPLWQMKLLTLPDFYRRRYGPRAEIAASVLMVPGYFGWIAAQFVALSLILELYLGVPQSLGLPMVAVFGVVYTLLGGMWAVTLTDAVQIALVAVGLVVIGGAMLLDLGGGEMVLGWSRLLAEVPAEKQVWIPEGEMLAWTGLFAAGALGNLPGQDLTQRLFAARSEQVAVSACYLAGVLYLSLGMIPLMIGLGADILLPASLGEGILPALAGHLLHPGVAVLFVVTLVSAVLSTIDSAILAPATVIAHNLWHRGQQPDGFRAYQVSVVLVAVCALGLAFTGESAYSMLETAYELGMVGLLVPLLGGIWFTGGGERTALSAMGVGGGAWFAHILVGAEGLFGTVLPIGLGATMIAIVVFGIGLYLSSTAAFSK